VATADELDEVDRTLLTLLIENSRLSHAELGRRVKLSRAAVRERVNRLVRRGVIERFTVVLNPEALGKHVSAFFQIDVEPHHLLDVASVLANNEDVVSMYQTTGPSTLHVHAVLRDRADLERFLTQVLYRLEGITRVESHIVLTRFKTEYGVRV